jgi:hypothetical protein
MIERRIRGHVSQRDGKEFCYRTDESSSCVFGNLKSVLCAVSASMGVLLAERRINTSPSPIMPIHAHTQAHTEMAFKVSRTFQYVYDV